MALLDCYLDDSHDGLEQEVFAVAGYYGWSLGFFDAEREWEHCLTRHGLQYFHAIECEQVQGQFFKLRKDPRYNSLASQKAAAAGIRSELISILNQHVGFDGIGLAVPLEAYRKVLDTEPDASILLQDRHFYFAYHHLMIELVKKCEDRFKGHWIGFVCDDHSRRDEAEKAYDELKTKNPRSARMMASMTHADDKITLPLQMADLLAYEVRRAAMEQLRHKPAFAGDVINQLSESIWFIGYPDENYLRAAVRDLVEQRNGADER